MKKTYLNPTTSIVFLETQHVVAASPFSFNDTAGTGSGTLSEETVTGDAMSRGRGAWDDED